MTSSTCYVVTHLETDGPEPGRNAMRSFASVAVKPDGTIFDSFEIRLAPVDGSEPNPQTMAWFKTRPEVWEDVTRDPQPPELGMRTYVAWLNGLGARPVFATQPLAYIGLWMDWYLRKFVGAPWMWGFRMGDPPFTGTGLDLRSLIMGTMGWDYAQCAREHLPKEWFGGHLQAHQALDAALGWAHVLGEMVRRQRKP